MPVIFTSEGTAVYHQGGKSIGEIADRLCAELWPRRAREFSRTASSQAFFAGGWIQTHVQRAAPALGWKHHAADRKWRPGREYRFRKQAEGAGRDPKKNYLLVHVPVEQWVPADRARGRSRRRKLRGRFNGTEPHLRVFAP